MDELSLIQKHLDESIEDALSTKLSFSALHLTSAHEDNELGDVQCLIEDQVSYRLLKQKLASSVLPSSKLVKPKMKSTSSSLFDMFSSSSHFSERLNIRDILDASESQLLDRCYEANVDDLILGFNTSNAEVVLLGSMLFDQLVLEISTHEKNDNFSSKSFLDVHTKWMDASLNEEECHPFAFVLLRNVILGVQYAKLPNNTIRLVRSMMKMFFQYMKISNDGTTFQASCIQIFYLLIEIFFGQHKSLRGAHAVLAYYDQDGELFSQCISSISSRLVIQNCILRTNCIQYLLKMILDLSSTQDEAILILAQMDKNIDPETMLVVHLLSLLKVAILNVSSLTFPCPIAEKNEIVNFLTLEDLPTIFSSSFEATDSLNCKKSESDKTIMCLLLPYYQVLDIGVTSGTYHSFDTTLGNICEDAIVHIILCGCSQDHILVHRAMSYFLELLKKVTSALDIASSAKKMFHKDDSSGLLVLSPALRSLFQIYKRILVDLPWSDLHDYSFVQQHCTSIFLCLRDLLLVSKDLGGIHSMSWKSCIDILLPITQNDDLRDLVLNNEESQIALMALIAHHEFEVIGTNSIEFLMVLHSALFSVKGYKVTGNDGKLLARSASIHCWGAFFTGCGKGVQTGDILYISQKCSLSRHLIRTEEVSSATKCLSEILLAKTLTKQIKEMLR